MFGLSIPTGGDCGLERFEFGLEGATLTEECVPVGC
jgi:hypothetical protein